MIPSRCTTKQICILVVLSMAACSIPACADSLHLRDGRHLQGKYVGGSTTMIGFMTSGSVEYFQTSDVLALMFDTNVEPPVSGLQPNRMNGDSTRMAAPATVQKISVQSGTDKKLHAQTTPRKANAALRYLAD